MTQMAMSEEIAAELAAKAAAHRCSTDDLLRSMLVRFESDEEIVNRVLTPELQARISADLQLDRSEYKTSEEVDAWFENLYKELEAR